MTYDVVFHLSCDWPDGCTATWVKPIGAEGGAALAAAAEGWHLSEDWDLCPKHAAADLLPPVEIELVPPALTDALDAPANKGWALSGGWTPRNLWPWARVPGPGRHAHR